MEEEAKHLLCKVLGLPHFLPPSVCPAFTDSTFFSTSFVLLQLEKLLLCYPIQNHRFERTLQGHHVHFQKWTAVLEISSIRSPFQKRAENHLMTSYVSSATTGCNRRQPHLVNATSITSAKCPGTDTAEQQRRLLQDTPQAMLICEKL